MLSAERVARIFGKHQNLFAMSGIYATVNVLWAFLGQVLHDGKESACQAAVAAITAHRLARGLTTPTSDTGDYCKARAKLSEIALRELTVEIADELEERAEAPWLWKTLHAKLVDGFTLTMPDMPENQAGPTCGRCPPQSRSQKQGVGLPIARCLAILSLATVRLWRMLDVASGPYSGKETGETAGLPHDADHDRDHADGCGGRHEGRHRCPRSPSAKSPTVPAESSPASSNAVATATSSCNNHEPSSKHNFKMPTAKHDST